MKTLATYAFEALVSSGVLLAAYTLLLERRVPFRWCRVYLIATTCMAALIPLLRIPVWPAKVIALAPIDALPVTGGWIPEATPEPILTTGMLVAVCYLTGVAILAGLLLAQLLRIRRLHRGAAVTHAARYRIIRTPQKIAPFSLFRTIYVWDGTPEAQFRAIAAHEASHIAHRHTAERILMECLKALLWWNPFVWMAARRLTEAEEFEADSDVLRGGYDLQEYMQTIFTQLMGYSPDIASNLRDSLTKKRFQMMTTKLSGRYGLLRLAGTLPALLALLCAFSFTARATVVESTQSAPADSLRPIRVSMFFSRDAKPLPGVIVRLDQTDRGLVSDMEGKVHFTTPAGTVLEVLYPGCEKRIFQVPDAARGEVSYALTMPEEKPDPAAAETASAEPLFLFDGIEVDPDKLDPARIESIRVLRGEETARYGEKGRNGVVLATSKKIPPVTPRPAAATTTGTAAPNATDATSASSHVEDDQPFLVVEQMPAFQGGDLFTFRTWLQQQIHYPAEAVKNGIEGRVILSFILERDGSVSNVRVLQTPDKSLADEAVRVIASSPTWTPGRQHGQTVRVKYVVPVDFSLDRPQTAAAAQTERPTPIDDDRPFLVVEQMPSFQGGDLHDFRQWVMTRIRYPEEALKAGQTGRVIAQFIIERDGTLSHPRIIESPADQLSDEVVRVLKTSPRWQPGMQRGQVVRVVFTLPVDFRIPGKNAPEERKKLPGEIDRIIVVGYESNK